MPCSFESSWHSPLRGRACHRTQWTSQRSWQQWRRTGQVGFDWPECVGCARVDNRSQNTRLLRKDWLVDLALFDQLYDVSASSYGDCWFWTPAPSTTSQLPNPVHSIPPLMSLVSAALLFISLSLLPTCSIASL